MIKEIRSIGPYAKADSFGEDISITFEDDKTYLITIECYHNVKVTPRFTFVFRIGKHGLVNATLTKEQTKDVLDWFNSQRE